MSDELLPYSELALSVKPGLYRHFKGEEYVVLGVAKHSEDLDQEFVVYKSVTTGTLWVRPLAMFLEHIDRDNYHGPRFIYIKNK